MVVYGHIHRSCVRSVSGMRVVNAGSEYDVDRELKEFAKCGLPHADRIAKTLEGAGPRMPQGRHKRKEKRQAKLPAPQNRERD